MDKNITDTVDIKQVITEAKRASSGAMLYTSFLKDHLSDLGERLDIYQRVFDRYDAALLRAEEHLKRLQWQEGTALDIRPVKIPEIKESIKERIDKASTLGELQLALGDAYGDVAEMQLRIWVEIKSKPTATDRGE